MHKCPAAIFSYPLKLDCIFVTYIYTCVVMVLYERKQMKNVLNYSTFSIQKSSGCYNKLMLNVWCCRNLLWLFRNWPRTLTCEASYVSQIELSRTFKFILWCGSCWQLVCTTSLYITLEGRLIILYMLYDIDQSFFI